MCLLLAVRHLLVTGTGWKLLLVLVETGSLKLVKLEAGSVCHLHLLVLCCTPLRCCPSALRSGYAQCTYIFFLPVEVGHFKWVPVTLGSVSRWKFRGMENFTNQTSLPRREFSSAFMTTARKSRGNPAEMPREVKFVVLYKV